jgi:segregation and condensation protein A
MQSVLSIVLQEDEITWRDVLLNLVKTRELDPWNVDIQLLTQEYLKMLSKLKELDFKVSGKVLLAAALLVRIKSERLLEEDIAHFDEMMTTVSEEDIGSFYDEMEFGDVFDTIEQEGPPQLIPRMPQLKKRRVSVYDLIEALEGALETPPRARKVSVAHAAAVEIPTIKIDISAMISALSDRLENIFKAKKRIGFSELSGPGREERVLTILPLLHLANIDHRLVDLHQEGHFSEIYVTRANE